MLTNFTSRIIISSSSTTGKLTQGDCYQADIIRTKGKPSLSQLHFLLRFCSRFCCVTNARQASFRLLFGRLILSPLFIWIAFLFAGCEKKESSIIDSQGTPPQLTQVTLSPSQINSDTINVGSNRQPEDVLTISTTVVARIQGSSSSPTSAHYTVSSSDSLRIVSQGTLVDDGLSPDQSKGDGLFTANASFQIRRVQVGKYVVEVYAQSPDGYRSNSLISNLVVFRGNHAPVISGLSAPDTIKLGGQSQVLLLTLRASDPDGLGDVAKVVFSSFRPDGSASGGNPFAMYDDGSAMHGDEIAGDGIFSLLVSLPASTQVGTYRFEFQAFDRSNESSNVIVHRISVRP